MANAAAVSSVVAPQLEGPYVSHHCLISGAYSFVKLEKGRLYNSVARFSTSMDSISFLNFLKLSRAIGGYGSLFSPAPQVSGTNSPLMMLPSGQFTGSGSRPISLAKVNASESDQIKAEPVA